MPDPVPLLADLDDGDPAELAGVVRLAAAGVTAWLLVQALVNMGSVLAVLPIVGVPLPLVSYGGSALVPMLIAIGMLVWRATRAISSGFSGGVGSSNQSGSNCSSRFARRIAPAGGRAAGGTPAPWPGWVANAAGPQVALWISGGLAALAVPGALAIGAHRRTDALALPGLAK